MFTKFIVRKQSYSLIDDEKYLKRIGLKNKSKRTCLQFIVKLRLKKLKNHKINVSD